MLFVRILFFPHSVVSSIYYPLTESRHQEWIECGPSMIHYEFQLMLNSIQVVDYQFVTRRVISIVKVSAEPIPRTKHNRDHEEKSDTKLCCIVCCLSRLGEGLCQFY